MKIPGPARTGAVALALCGLVLSGCATDDYGRSWGSVSVGTGWYDGYYPGYYPYDYGWWGYPGWYDRPGYVYRPRGKLHRHWKDRPSASRPWQGRHQKDGGEWYDRDKSSHKENWQGRDERPRAGSGDGRPRGPVAGQVRQPRPGGSDRAARWRAERGEVMRPAPRQQRGDRR